MIFEEKKIETDVLFYCLIVSQNIICIRNELFVWTKSKFLCDE